MIVTFNHPCLHGDWFPHFQPQGQDAYVALSGTKSNRAMGQLRKEGVIRVQVAIEALEKG